MWLNECQTFQFLNAILEGIFSPNIDEILWGTCIRGQASHFFFDVVLQNWKQALGFLYISANKRQAAKLFSLHIWKGFWVVDYSTGLHQFLVILPHLYLFILAYISLQLLYVKENSHCYRKWVDKLPNVMKILK